MILLSEEEMLKVLDRIPRVKAGDSLIPMVEMSAKAQLKKVVEWLREHQTAEMVKERLCFCLRDADFNALLKEIE